MKTTKTTNRRKFLMAAGLGGAGAAAAVIAGKQAPVVKAEAAVEASQATSYRATPHILKYYKTTEV